MIIFEQRRCDNIRLKMKVNTEKVTVTDGVFFIAKELRRDGEKKICKIVQIQHEMWWHLLREQVPHGQD
jgi:hypothetical protein